MPRSEKPVEVLSGAPDDVLNVSAVAELLGCNARDVVELFKAGTLAGRRHGNGGWRTTRRTVLAYIEGQKSNE